jgi:hypothetical protein
VDALVHHLQGKAESLDMQREELLKFLTDVTADRIALLQRHEAGARVVSHYDFNNTYQYVINREETHLRWLQDALGEFGVGLPQPATTYPVPEVGKSKKGDLSVFRGVLEDDVRTLRAFVDRWRPRVEKITHARHRTMLGVMLGESLEYARMFEQAAGGFEDVLGKRSSHTTRVGAVLPTRWLE